MRMGIRGRLFLALLIATTGAVLAMFLILRWGLDRGFRRFIDRMEAEQTVQLTQLLETSYAQRGSWDFLGADGSNWQLLLHQAVHQEPGDRERHEPHTEHGSHPPHVHPGPPPGPPPDEAERLDHRLLLLDASHHLLAGPPATIPGVTTTPLYAQGTLIGYLGVRPRHRPADRGQRRFLAEQQLSLGLVAGALILISAAVSLFLSRRLAQPVRKVVAGTRQLAAGNYDARVPVTTADELGQLAEHFNRLAATLARTELARRQWIADISHELRTPVAVLQGEIDAIQDGVRRPTEPVMQSLQDGIQRLGRLVEDLYQLALADLGTLSYRKVRLDLLAALEASLESFRPRFMDKGIVLDVELPAQTLTVNADPQRLGQLFANLLDNTLKYTDYGGRLEVRCEDDGARVRLTLRDSPPGVPEEELEHLFERFFRVDPSRSRSTGGAGLGLAICRNIVEAHDGTITAGTSPLGGIAIAIELPLAGEDA